MLSKKRIAVIKRLHKQSIRQLGWSIKVIEELLKEVETLNLIIAAAPYACNDCNIANECEFAFDPYNLNSVAKIDCLASK
jgi:hypothetical protein